MAALDRALLATIGRTRPRVVILPAASGPDGEAVFRRWADMGERHFTALGAEVEPVLVRTAEEASDAAVLQAIGEADLVYIPGGNSAHLGDVLVGSPLGAAIRAAHARGAVVAGCSAGAMVLADRHLEFGRRRLLWPVGWCSGLALISDITVFPHYDAWPEPVIALMALQSPRGTTVLGIDEDTAVVVQDGSWRVHGRGRVTLWRGRHRERFRRDDSFRI